MRRAAVALVAAFALLLSVTNSSAQQPEARPESGVKPTVHIYPTEIHGYKLERANVKIKKPQASHAENQDADAQAADADALIQFGEPRIVSTTPLGITVEVPVTIAAVKQGGHVDFLAFEDMVVNGMPVTIEDYCYSFDLPNKQPANLPEPVHLYVSTASALLGALGQWSQPKDVWPVTGRVYVFGHFKKYLFNFKRVVPVELSLSLPNPLKKKQQIDPAFKQ
jgi:hypothetical protein